jgi:hypothetical protein
MREGETGDCGEPSHSQVQVSGPESRTSHIGVGPQLPIHSTAVLCHKNMDELMGDGRWHAPHTPKRRSLYVWNTALAAWGYRLMTAERCAYLA